MRKNKNSEIGSYLDQAFDRFWAAYPKHRAKKDAKKAFAQLNPTPELMETMIGALAWQSRQSEWLKDGGQWVPYAATWIRGERWTDEPPPNGSNGGGGLHFNEKTINNLRAIYGTH